MKRLPPDGLSPEEKTEWTGMRRRESSRKYYYASRPTYQSRAEKLECLSRKNAESARKEPSILLRLQTRLMQCQPVRRGRLERQQAGYNGNESQNEIPSRYRSTSGNDQHSFRRLLLDAQWFSNAPKVVGYQPHHCLRHAASRPLRHRHRTWNGIVSRHKRRTILFRNRSRLHAVRSKPILRIWTDSWKQSRPVRTNGSTRSRHPGV
jgi:hypothetical protein